MSDFLHRPNYGERVSLADYPAGFDSDLDQDTAREATLDLQKRLIELQNMLFAQSKYALLIVLQAMDGGGKDSTIKAIFQGVNPQGVRVTGFKVPTSEELAHDFLWRIHRQVPAKGMIGIFNRSHYEDVLVVRVNEIVPEPVWRARYEQINAFEQLLAANGTTILKFYLNISKNEQKKRFIERLTEPDKHWKFSRGDLPVRERWDDYMQAYEDVFTHCHTPAAPWHIIPANKKWYRNYAIMRTIVQTLEAMPLAYPAPEEGLEDIVIPD